MFIRYGMTGAIATTFHYLILLLLVEAFGVMPWIATGVGAICGAIIAYIGNRKFTFASQIPTNSTSNYKTLARFLIIAALGAALNILLMWLMTHYLNFYYFAAQIIATIIVLIVTYHLNRHWTFASCKLQPTI